jgi:hypothetical protein
MRRCAENAAPQYEMLLRAAKSRYDEKLTQP